jgi:hypothetical protein
MTCEVAVMNKYALVIAADSAVTTTNGSGAERYSKGGNKIFQLSRQEPVGVMIYGSAMLNGVPWEIVIKNYRDVLGAAGFPTLSEYASSFFDFVRTAAHFFPPADLIANLHENVLRIALNFLVESRSSHPDIDDTTKSEPERGAAWRAYVAEKKATLDAAALPAEISDATMQDGIREVQDPANDRSLINDFVAGENLAGVVSVDELMDLGCHHFFKNFSQILGRTGIVFSGFGKDEYFPVVIQYDVFGFVRQEFVFRKIERNSCEISHNDPSGIFQFAMTSSIDTFTTGVGFDTYAEVNRAYLAAARALTVDTLQTNSIAHLPDNFDANLQASCEKFTQGWFNKILAVHYHPMKRVIASLPIQEMVHLAETLIVLQSLKERITTHSESVGGPVDIAVITKAEGLVWIKRKHYFDADRNLPYVLRQKAQYE